jgi:arylsulfatase A-like enzyme
MFSGLLPTEHGITGDCMEIEAGRQTSPAGAVRAFAGTWLPEDLRERGYRTYGVSCNPWVSTWGGFDRGFDDFDDVRMWAPRRRGRAGSALRRAVQAYAPGDHGGRRTLRRFERRLARTGKEPWFAMVNLMETHAPYDPPLRFHPLLRSSARDRWLSPYFQIRQMGLRRDATEAYRTALRHLYEASARYLDLLVGRFVRAVERAGRPTLLALVSDHGENLGEHGLFAHHSSLHQTLIHVPLVLWGRGVNLERGVEDRPVSILHLAEWFLRSAEGQVWNLPVERDPITEYESTERHIGLPRELRGRSGRDRGPLPDLVRRAGVAIRRGDLKLVAVEDRAPKLFDLRVDPAEHSDAATSRPESVRAFEPQVQAWKQRRVRRPQYDVGSVPEQEIEAQLRSLGYIE